MLGFQSQGRLCVPTNQYGDRGFVLGGFFTSAFFFLLLLSRHLHHLLPFRTHSSHKNILEDIAVCTPLACQLAYCLVCVYFLQRPRRRLSALSPPQRLIPSSPAATLHCTRSPPPLTWKSNVLFRIDYLAPSRCPGQKTPHNHFSSLH